MKKLIVIMLLVMLVGFTNCTNPFSTRNAEEPDLGSGRTVNGKSLQTNPDSLLRKVEKSFQFRDPQSYKDCLADSLEVGTEFHFVPEKDEQFRFLNWTRDDEVLYFTNFVNNQEIVSTALMFTDITPWTPITPSTQDTLQTSFNYLIDVKFRTKRERYQGRSILRIFKSSTELWYIYQWEDFKLQTAVTDSTWSTLKANYRY